MQFSTIRRATLGGLVLSVGLLGLTGPAHADTTPSDPVTSEVDIETLPSEAGESTQETPVIPDTSEQAGDPSPSLNVAGSRCPVEFNSTRLWDGNVEYGGRVTCYGPGIFTIDVYLLKWRVDKQKWVVVDHTSATHTGSSKEVKATAPCNGPITRTYKVHFVGYFSSAVASIPGGSFDEWKSPNNVACNAM